MKNIAGEKCLSAIYDIYFVLRFERNNVFKQCPGIGYNFTPAQFHKEHFPVFSTAIIQLLKVANQSHFSNIKC